MGTFFKYVFYIILVLVIYLVGKGVYDGSINQSTTIGNAIEQVDDSGRQMMKDGYQSMNKTINEVENKDK